MRQVDFGQYAFGASEKIQTYLPDEQVPTHQSIPVLDTPLRVVDTLTTVLDIPRQVLGIPKTVLDTRDVVLSKRRITSSWTECLTLVHASCHPSAPKP